MRKSDTSSHDFISEDELQSRTTELAGSLRTGRLGLLEAEQQFDEAGRQYLAKLKAEMVAGLADSVEGGHEKHRVEKKGVKKKTF